MIRRSITSSVLASFLLVVLFSFVLMTYGPDGRMQGDCPFTSMRASMCPQDVQTAVMHHIAAYESFLNVPVGSGMTLLVAALLLAVVAAYIVGIIFAQIEIRSSRHYFYLHAPPSHFRTRKIIRWLSLLENSPSLI